MCSLFIYISAGCYSPSLSRWSLSTSQVTWYHSQDPLFPPPPSARRAGDSTRRRRSSSSASSSSAGLRPCGRRSPSLPPSARLCYCPPPVAAPPPGRPSRPFPLPVAAPCSPPVAASIFSSARRPSASPACRLSARRLRAACPRRPSARCVGALAPVRAPCGSSRPCSPPACLLPAPVCCLLCSAAVL